jgi:hypothetical protein
MKNFMTTPIRLRTTPVARGIAPRAFEPALEHDTSPPAHHRVVLPPERFPQAVCQVVIKFSLPETEFASQSIHRFKYGLHVLNPLSILAGGFESRISFSVGRGE